MDVVSIDKSGRIVLPLDIRKRVGITRDSKLLIVDIAEDKILIKKLNRDEIAKRLKKELKDIDIDRIVGKVKAEINDEIKKEYADIFS
jgi:bifunctional DNA-binding transcriptional regulator/antitoxin component of YhaV-PrlF toxin-antitoxin module